MESLESFRTVRKVVGRSGRFPTDLDSLEISGQFGKSPEGLERFQTVWKVFFLQFGRFPDGPESFQIVQRVSKQPGKRKSLLTGKLQLFRPLLHAFCQPNLGANKPLSLAMVSTCLSHPLVIQGGLYPQK